MGRAQSRAAPREIFFGPARVLILQFLLKRETASSKFQTSAPALRDFCVGQAQ
jgi:hypothetical protein